MTEGGGAGIDRVTLLDLARSLPNLAADLPVIVRGLRTGLVPWPGAKVSLATVFQDRAAQHGDRVFIRFGDRELTYAQANARANQYAAVFADRGVRRGDVVAIMMRNSPEMVLAMIGVVKCGAVAGMLNYHQREEVLAHSLNLLNSTVLVADSDFISAVAECGGPAGQVLSIDDLGSFADSAPAANPPTAAQVLATDPAFYIFTSGTTGLPKASVMTHRRWLAALAGIGGFGVRLRGSDTLYCCLPLYHNNALTVALGSVLVSGSTLAIGVSFSASRFWDEVIACRATAFIYIGELCRYLLNQPPKPTDRQHHIRVMAGNGLRPDIWTEFTERFGIERVCEFYAASESNLGFVNVFNIPGTIGIFPLPLAYVEYDLDTGYPRRFEDGRVRRVPPGTPGLLLSPVTKVQPFDGYTDAEATEKKLVRNAFRDGDVWFNTGDVLSPQGFGHAAFVDRIGDTFRWKGENVATTEVEAVLGAHPTVEHCTVYGVEVPNTGGRAGMAALVLADGATFDGQSIAAAVYEHLPVYALPLFIRLVKSLEMTSTFKSRKVELREQAYGPEVEDPLYVLDGRGKGYVPFYADYPDGVAAGRLPGA